MSSRAFSKPSRGSSPEPSTVKKPAGSVKEVPCGDFVSIHSRAVLNDKLEEIANLASEATSADGVAIALRDGENFVCRASLGFAPELGVSVEPGQGICGQCLSESRLILAQDLTGEVKSALAAPVVLKGKVEGLIAAFSFRPGAFAASHSELLCCLSSDIAQGLEFPENIHLVRRDENAGIAADPDDTFEPSSRDKRLAILDAVTSPVSSTGAASLSEEEVAPPPSEFPRFRFLGYGDASSSFGFETPELKNSRRPFRNHWDIVMILAAVLIAALTFGIWLHYHRSQPYTGKLVTDPGATLAECSCTTHFEAPPHSPGSFNFL
ncbi:MAG: GAF domain-containing protein [Acidobacteriaceae bacterium]